jgi:ERF superfamily protein
MVATIPAAKPGERERIFHYAPLCSGLDIVRKTLGRYEIATVQTTAVDATAGIVNLTTTLAHASGQWIASDWPVCSVAEIASPQRMGAALTYARRYALFTLVGIAGEDDVDAPDISGGPPSAPSRSVNGGSQAAAALRIPRPVNGRRDRYVPKSGAHPVLAPDESAALRVRLIGELASLVSTDAAASWAQGMLATKNKLTHDDSKYVEEIFEKKLSELLLRDAPEKDQAVAVDASLATLEAQSAPTSVAAKEAEAVGLTKKGVLAVPKPRRHRNKAHLRFVAKQACLICGRKPSDPHHLGSRSHVRSAARSAMSSLSRSVAGITGKRTAHAMSARGGSRPA